MSVLRGVLFFRFLKLLVGDVEPTSQQSTGLRRETRRLLLLHPRTLKAGNVGVPVDARITRKSRHIMMIICEGIADSLTNSAF